MRMGASQLCSPGAQLSHGRDALSVVGGCGKHLRGCPFGEHYRSKIRQREKGRRDKPLSLSFWPPGVFCSPAREYSSFLCWELGSRPLAPPGLPGISHLSGKREAAGLRKGHPMWTQDCPGAYEAFRVWNFWNQEE